MVLSQPKFFPSIGFLAHIAISWNETLRDYTIVLFEVRIYVITNHAIIVQSWRHKNFFHGQGLQVQFYLRGPLHRILFQVYFPFKSLFLSM